MTFVKKLYKLTFDDGAIDYLDYKPTLIECAKYNVIKVDRVKTSIDISLDFCQIQEIGGNENE